MLNFYKIPSHESLTEDTSSIFKSLKLHIFCSITIFEITKQKQPFQKKAKTLKNKPFETENQFM